MVRAIGLVIGHELADPERFHARTTKTRRHEVTQRLRDSFCLGALVVPRWVSLGATSLVIASELWIRKDFTCEPLRPEDTK